MSVISFASNVKLVNSLDELNKLFNLPASLPVGAEPGPGPVVRPVAVIIPLPANYTVNIGGTALALWEQRITIVQKAPEGKPVHEYHRDTMTGNNSSGKVLRTPSKAPSVVYDPVSADTEIVINFETKPPSEPKWRPAKDLANDYEATELKVKNIAYALCFHTEDGGDTDYHDTNIVVSFVHSLK